MSEVFDDQTKTVLTGVQATKYAGDVRYAVHPELPGGVPLKYVKVTGLGPRPHKTTTITTGLVAEMDQSEKDAYDAAELNAAKVARRQNLVREAWAYLESKYDPGEQRILVDLHIETYANAKPNRRAALEEYFEWREQCMQSMKASFLSIAACTTVAEVNAVVLDTATMDVNDPGINLIAILNIAD